LGKPVCAHRRIRMRLKSWSEMAKAAG